VPRYENLDGRSMPHGARTILKWKLGLAKERHPRAPARAPVPAVDNDGRDIAHAARPAITWIGHASFVVQLGGRTIFTDPVMSSRLSGVVPRNVAPGLSWSALPRPDVVVVTHNHRDHMDAGTLKKIGADPVFVVPKGLRPWFERAGLRRVVELGWWEEEEVEGVHITFVPAQHWSRRGLNDQNTTLWGGFVLERDGLRVYHSGDTAWFEGFAEIGRRAGPIDAALLPIGAYAPRWFMKTQHMNPEDAVAAFGALGAARFVAMHWGTFKLTDEDLREPPEFLRRVWEERGLADRRREIPAIGETIWLDTERPTLV
jgi:L-ascorbate metabolism protein UlaG (beta-lactamase superfamily)